MAADTYPGDTIGMVIARHDLHERGLARPIGTDEPTDFAPFDRKRDIRQGEGAPKALGQPFDGERRDLRRCAFEQRGAHDHARLLSPNLPILTSKIDVAAIVLSRGDHRRI